jgi:signal transduction histidine kinase
VWQYILAIYRNVIILIATIYFFSADKNTILAILLFISVIYTSVMMLLRAVETKIVSDCA